MAQLQAYQHIAIYCPPELTIRRAELHPKNTIGLSQYQGTSAWCFGPAPGA